MLEPHANLPLRIREMQIRPLRIPMRVRFEHATAQRDVADPVIVQLTAAAPFAEHVGYGETLARPYVTGESVASVVDDLQTILAPLLLDFRPTSFAEALEFIDTLPFDADGRVICAARAAIELALIDLAGRVFGRRAADVAGWLDLPGFGPPGCLETARYSGVVIGRSRRKLKLMLHAQRWYGLRDFKIKVAVRGWQERLIWTYEVLRRPLRQGRVTLRADANAGWSFAEARSALAILEDHGVSALEQPLADQNDGHLPALAQHTTCDLIADESLLTPDDARRLIAEDAVRVLNIRIAKNGGLMPALRIARQALAAGLDVQLGCLVGETSILTAAGAAFLEVCPSVRFVEGAFGRWLLREDVARPSLHFGHGGRLRRRGGHGLGLNVDAEIVRRLAAAGPVLLRL
ncbi:MAG: hypothetical protein JXO22_05835 [Phycisphaerae bacterium]|nr:hypothetical protein [Phycisphaerae bacterium]